MGHTVPIEWGRAKKKPCVRYLIRRMQATQEYFFGDDAKWEAAASRATAELPKPIESAWMSLYALEGLIAKEIGEEHLDGPVGEDDADPVFRWWNGRMEAVFCAYYRDRDYDGRKFLFAWAVEEVQRRGEAPSNHWRLLEVLEERVLEEIREHAERAAAPGEGRA